MRLGFSLEKLKRFYTVTVIKKAFDAMGPVEHILSYVDGLEVEPIATSCCGMAGDFGYAADTLIIADGTSCRSQIFDGSGRQAIHAARFLDRQMAGIEN